MSLQAYTIIVYVKNTYVSCQYSLHNHGVCHTPRYHVNADLHNHGLHQKKPRYHVNTGLPNHGLCHTPRYMYHVNTGLHNHGLYQKTPSYNVNTGLHNHGLHHTPRYHVNKGYTIMVYVRNTKVSWHHRPTQLWYMSENTKVSCQYRPTQSWSMSDNTKVSCQYKPTQSWSTAHTRNMKVLCQYSLHKHVICQKTPWASEGKHTQQPTMPYHTSLTSSYTYIIHLFN